MALEETELWKADDGLSVGETKVVPDTVDVEFETEEDSDTVEAVPTLVTDVDVTVDIKPDVLWLP